MEENLYFAYGSNLDLEQMAQRCPDAEIVGPVRLENYELRFRGSGFCYRCAEKRQYCPRTGVEAHAKLRTVSGPL